ncbi:isochorismatase family protein [Streptomyces sp. NPDC018031]|uniref:isochorismatase family protein n=1 Tax=Streptomyces sp. NPDC018031 TaxID=3365033 RepID=UPI003795A7F5
MNPALILIDLMPRIVALPLAPHSGEEVERRCRRLAGAFRAKSLPVAVVRVERPGVPEQPPGSDLVDQLLHPDDIAVVKRTIGAFHGTDLDARLRARGVDTVVVAGLVTTMGVESTARAAVDHGYQVEFVADAMSGFAADEHDFTVERVFPRLGSVRHTANYV